MRRPNLRFLLLSAICISIPIACATAVEQNPDGEGGAGGEGGDPTGASSTTGSGPCVYAPECAHLTDACGDGACVNSACVKLPNPAKDGIACDDGKQCTQNDACKDGECTGALKLCPSSDPCLTGLCDVETDACIEVPGNDGTPCVDNDPCTQTAVCQGGVCSPGIPTNCAIPPKSQCIVGYCEPGVGCKTMPANDGGKCDDGLFCTVSDACQGGACKGEPNPCGAAGDVCKTAVCNEQQDICQSVPGNNGAMCDDASACTTGETCANGVCGGGAPANDGSMCDDKNACTAGDVCQAGGCSGATIVGCASGDGCCPSGCDFVADDDCGGMVYVTSADGSPGFYGYDIVADTWSALPLPPAPTCSQLTTDGTNVLLLGTDNTIYSYSPSASQWSPVVAGPGLEASFPMGFFKWTPSGYYYIKDSSNVIKYTTAGGNIWSSALLPVAGSCAGTFDPVTGNLHIRAYSNFGLMIFSTASNSLVKYWPNFMSCGESSRTGSYYGGFFFEREFDNPFYKVDVATGMGVNTGVKPSEGHTSTDVDLATGDIYIGPYKPTGQAFQVFNVPTNALKNLAPLPMFVINTTLVVVK